MIEIIVGTANSHGGPHWEGCGHNLPTGEEEIMDEEVYMESLLLRQALAGPHPVRIYMDEVDLEKEPVFDLTEEGESAMLVELEKDGKKKPKKKGY